MNEESRPRDHIIRSQAQQPMNYVNETVLQKEIEHINAQRKVVEQHEFELDHDLNRFNERFQLEFFDLRLRQEYIGKFYNRLHQIQLQKQNLDVRKMEKQNLLQQLNLQKAMRSPPPILTPPLTPQSVASCPEDNPFLEEKVNTEVIEGKLSSKIKTKPSPGSVFIDLTGEDEEDAVNDQNDQETLDFSKEKVVDGYIEKYFAKMGNDYVFVSTDIPDLMEDLGEVQYPSPSFDQMIKTELNQESKQRSESISVIKQESAEDVFSVVQQKQPVPALKEEIPDFQSPAYQLHRSSSKSDLKVSIEYADVPSYEEDSIDTVSSRSGNQAASTSSFIKKEKALHPSVSLHKVRRSSIFIFENQSILPASSECHASTKIGSLNSNPSTTTCSSIADNESHAFLPVSGILSSSEDTICAAQPALHRDRNSRRSMLDCSTKRVTSGERQDVPVERLPVKPKQACRQESIGKRKREEAMKTKAPPSSFIVSKKKPTVMSDCQKMFVAEKILKKKMQKRSKEKRLLKTGHARRFSSDAPSDLPVNAARPPLIFSCYQQRNSTSRPLAAQTTPTQMVRSPNKPCKDFDRNFFEVFEVEFKND